MIDIKDLGPESIGKWVNTQNDVFTGTIAPCYLNKQF